MNEPYNFFFKKIYGITKVDKTALIFNTLWKWYIFMQLKK